ncbi:MAG: type II toxin-antitoxin system HicA family toxin [Bacteroidales bacterium]|nr:type II toxin-antitoxin system HicA family toxin [Bacteroidales bacterium]
MSKKDKLKERFKKLPNDFSFDELVRLFASVGFMLDNKGSTSGSRARFRNGDNVYCLHRPHPENIVKRGVLKNIYDYLKSQKLL